MSNGRMAQKSQKSTGTLRQKKHIRRFADKGSWLRRSERHLEIQRSRIKGFEEHLAAVVHQRRELLKAIDEEADRILKSAATR